MAKLPLPFSNQTLSEWTALFRQSTAAEDRLRALQAISLQAQSDEIDRFASEALGDPDPMVRALAARLVGRDGMNPSSETEARLVSLLSDEDPDVQFESARTLIRKKSLQADRALPSLFARLDEPETTALMVAAVVNALTAAKLDQLTVDRQLRPRLMTILDHDRAEVREAVANAFAKWPSMSAHCLDRLIPLLDDPEPVVREKIAVTLGHSGCNTEAVRAGLETACADEDAEVARVAAEALAQLKAP